MDYSIKLFIRLGIAFFLGVFFRIFYFVFDPITFYLSYLSIKIIGFTAKIGGKGLLYVNNHSLNFANVCTAASAYYLLLLLILLTKDLGFLRSIKMFVLGSALILLFNIIRINILVYILVYYGENLFYSVHMAFWKIVSTIVVFLVWILLIKIFSVKSIPVYSDVVFLTKEMKKGYLKSLKRRKNKKIRKAKARRE